MTDAGRAVQPERDGFLNGNVPEPARIRPNRAEPVPQANPLP